MSRVRLDLSVVAVALAVGQTVGVFRMPFLHSIVVASGVGAVLAFVGANMAIEAAAGVAGFGSILAVIGLDFGGHPFEKDIFGLVFFMVGCAWVVVLVRSFMPMGSPLRGLRIALTIFVLMDLAMFVLDADPLALAGVGSGTAPYVAGALLAVVSFSFPRRSELGPVITGTGAVAALATQSLSSILVIGQPTWNEFEVLTLTSTLCAFTVLVTSGSVGSFLR